MRNAASNRPKKLLNFFGVRFGADISTGAAGWEIEWLMSDESKRDRWRRYLYLTLDFDSDSDELKPFTDNQLTTLIIPDN